MLSCSSTRWIGDTRRDIRRAARSSTPLAAAASRPFAASRRRLGGTPIAPASVQQRTMSRTESMPMISPPSTTTRWRKPPRHIVSAACSSDQSGSAKTMSAVRWSATCSASRSSPAPTDVEDVALGEDARARRLGIDDDRRRRPAFGHQLAPPGAACGPVRRSAPSRASPPHLHCRYLRCRLQRSVACITGATRRRECRRANSAQCRRRDSSSRRVCVRRRVHAANHHHPPSARASSTTPSQIVEAGVRHRPLPRRHRPPRRLLAPPAPARLRRDRRHDVPRAPHRRPDATAPPSCSPGGRLTVREVAHRVGYRQPAQFAKAFRRAITAPRRRTCAAQRQRPRASARSPATLEPPSAAPARPPVRTGPRRTDLTRSRPRRRRSAVGNEDAPRPRAGADASSAAAATCPARGDRRPSSPLRRHPASACSSTGSRRRVDRGREDRHALRRPHDLLGADVRARRDRRPLLRVEVPHAPGRGGHGRPADPRQHPPRGHLDRAARRS